MLKKKKAHHLEIWTDVYGMFSGDPRKMPYARLIQRISSREALELATSGAKVLSCHSKKNQPKKL